jgi:hypothetical protein
VQAAGPAFDELVLTDMAKVHLAGVTHAGFQALHDFMAAHGGALPDPTHPEHTETILAQVAVIVGAVLSAAEVTCVKQLVHSARGNLSPMTSVVSALCYVLCLEPSALSALKLDFPFVP